MSVKGFVILLVHFRGVLAKLTIVFPSTVFHIKLLSFLFELPIKVGGLNISELFSFT